MLFNQNISHKIIALLPEQFVASSVKYQNEIFKFIEDDKLGCFEIVKLTRK
jgi:hypothetical protein